MSGPVDGAVLRAMDLLPSAPCVLTSAFERRRAGVMVRWVMQCASEPLYVCVASRKGHRIEPLIRDSHAFGLCLIDRKERLILRKFDDEEQSEADPFDSFEVTSCVTGSPILGRCVAALDCLVVRHFDLEADCELYVGQVVGARCASA